MFWWENQFEEDMCRPCLGHWNGVNLTFLKALCVFLSVVMHVMLLLQMIEEDHIMSGDLYMGVGGRS